MKEKTKFIILGGLGEIGKNMYAIEHNDELISVKKILKIIFWPPLV